MPHPNYTWRVSYATRFIYVMISGVHCMFERPHNIERVSVLEKVFTIFFNSLDLCRGSKSGPRFA